VPGGNAIRILGTSFVARAMQVTIGGVVAPSVTYVTSTELLVTILL
jgi:hypothetical protein